jgi:tetratricopeptide (TPR) repeat protein
MATSARRKPAPVKKRAAHSSGSGSAPDNARTAQPAPAPELPPDERRQADLFEHAMKLFHAANYGAARSLFDKAAVGPVSAMAHSAQLHSAMCARRVAAREPALKTPEEHYNYAIALINEGQFAQAERHLTEAIARTPDADHIHYALALCRGLAGDLRAAYRHLRRAIEIQPRNRTAARDDPDFAGIAQLSPLFELLYPERIASIQPFH